MNEWLTLISFKTVFWSKRHMPAASLATHVCPDIFASRRAYWNAERSIESSICLQGKASATIQTASIWLSTLFLKGNFLSKKSGSFFCTAAAEAALISRSDGGRVIPLSIASCRFLHGNRQHPLPSPSQWTLRLPSELGATRTLFLHQRHG